MDQLICNSRPSVADDIRPGQSVHSSYRLLLMVVNHPTKLLRKTEKILFRAGRITALARLILVGACFFGKLLTGRFLVVITLRFQLATWFSTSSFCSSFGCCVRPIVLVLDDIFTRTLTKLTRYFVSFQN